MAVHVEVLPWIICGSFYCQTCETWLDNVSCKLGLCLSRKIIANNWNVELRSLVPFCSFERDTVHGEHL